MGSTSRSSIVRLCRQATGMSPMKRIQQIRMEEAKGLLLSSSLNITEIAQYLGYIRMHEFSREFTLYFGTSPKQFRNSIKNLSKKTCGQSIVKAYSLDFPK